MGGKVISRDIVKETSKSGIAAHSKRLKDNREFQEKSRETAAVDAKKVKIKEMKAEIAELEGKKVSVKETADK